MSIWHDVLQWLGLVGPATPPTPPATVDLFPLAPYSNPFAFNAKLDKAVKDAVVAKNCPNVRLTIADVTGAFATPPAAGPFPVGEHHGGDCDYIASVAKVAVLYAAYELRALVRRVIKALDPSTTPDDVFKALDALHDKISAATPNALSTDQTVAGKRYDDRHRLPHWKAMFAITNAGGALKADFTSAYGKALEYMIVVSNDGAAATCVHGIGYGYLNGALAAAGFLADADKATPKGVWVAGDFLGATNYPPIRIATTPNDDPAAETGTTNHLARMFALIKLRMLVSSASSGDDDTASEAMESLLKKTATTGGPDPDRGFSITFDRPWASEDPTRAANTPQPPAIPPAKFVYNKLGVGPITLGSGGPSVYSETSIIKGPVAARGTYVVSWQHMTSFGLLHRVVTAILAAITTYEKPPSVTGIAPASGPAAGGTSVAVTGTNLNGITRVRFGAIAATSFVMVSDTQITAVSPPAATGIVDVTVEDGSGTSTTSAADRFEFV